MSLTKHLFKCCSGTGRGPRPYTLPTWLFWARSALFLGVRPVSWYCLGSHRQWCWPTSRQHEAYEQWGAILSGGDDNCCLATSFEWHSVVTQLLKTHSFVWATLHTALGFGVAGWFCLWKPASVLSTTSQRSLANISTGKRKDLRGRRWMNKAKVGVGAWNQPQHEENVLPNSHGVCWACLHLGKML